MLTVATILLHKKYPYKGPTCMPEGYYWSFTITGIYYNSDITIIMMGK